MKLLLCRHGNTFAPEDKVVWTGSSNDLPLVEKGYEQARLAGQWLLQQGWATPIIYCSHLQRTKNYALEMIKEMELPETIQPTVTAYLNEIDYGVWTGLSDQEVIDNYGASGIEGWREKSLFPDQGQWNETEEQVTQRVGNFLKTLYDKHKNNTVIIVSSNGILRYFLKKEPRLFEQQILTQNFSVRTGHICAMELDENNTTLLFWNKKPFVDS